ncbi:MAG: hypothetical protein M3P82_01605 [Bacteroidota bacterium]|nr:hypothetical protein [Bacteroidota bacterium]
MKHAISWFTIPATDFKRAVKFYNSIFDFNLSEVKIGAETIAFFPLRRVESAVIFRSMKK